MLRYLLWIPIALFCANANAIVLYSQMPDLLHGGGGTSIGFEPITADNFTTDGNWLVAAATFQGSWVADRGAVGPNDTTRQFRVEFYADAGGIPVLNPFEQFSVTATMSNPDIFGELIKYDLAMTFPIPVELQPRTTYWFAVVDEGPGTGGAEGFFWGGSAEGDLQIAQRFFDGWQLYSPAADCGFVLTGAVVPEPRAWLMLCVAATFAVASRYRPH